MSPDISPAALWWWSGEALDRKRLRWQLERYRDGGVHNLVVINLAASGPMFGSDPDSPAFFSDDWWAIFEYVCERAAELGISIWFYDQIGFSGADVAARLVERNPSYAGQWLMPDGSVTASGFDYLSPEACAALLDAVHGEFERRLGHLLGSVIVGSFQDELPAMPTWSSSFAASFEERRGYPLSPLVLNDVDNPAGDTVRRDYHRTRAELAEEAFFRPHAAWHQKHGLLAGCDQQDPARNGDPVGGVRLYADYARTHRWFSAPGADHHGDARLHSSLAHLYGHPRTWIEAFHSSGWGSTLEETYDWLLPFLRAGANLYDPHATYYSTKGGWWEWAPPATDWRQPYWAHHAVFAGAVARLCETLSRGRHVCDVAVLLPTATVQAATGVPRGAEVATGAAARTAQRVYQEIVGDMTWFRTVPGVLDRLRREADVIDDDSLVRASVSGGVVRVADEAYRVIVLPACTVLDDEVAARLDSFVAGGGLLIAVEAMPPQLREHFAAGRAHLLRSAEDLGAVLAAVPPPVEAPVPSLVRDVDGTRIVFLPAAAPRASDVSVGAPEERGISLGWLDASYDFDPGRYHESIPVRVRGVSAYAVLVDPFTGSERVLLSTQVGDAVDVRVPFDRGPAALLMFPPFEAAAPDQTAALTEEVDLGSHWVSELVPTMDNTWGDFARPAGAPVALERWAMRHRTGDGAWQPAHATFGPHASGLTYSTSRGIRKDPIHRETLGPKGHVPEEFLAFGPVKAHRPARLRTDLIVATGTDGWLAVGAAAAKKGTLDGEPLVFTDHGYLAYAPVRLTAERHALDLVLTPTESLDLRAYVAVVGDIERFARPEWIQARGTGSRVVFSAPTKPGTIQVAARDQCVVRVDGVEVGRQGGFEPYAEQETPRVRRYEVPAGELSVELGEGAILVDGAARSGRHWTATRDGVPVGIEVRRRQYGDPAALHLPRRPHPLPETAWLADAPADGTVRPVVLADPDQAELQWLSFVVPPGATSLGLSAYGEVVVLVDGVERAKGVGDPVTLAVDLDGSRECTLRVVTRPGYSHGAILAGPVTFETGPGTIELGDWQEVGLPEYSGGVRYRRRFHTDLGSIVDLGRVRGTAEVVLNGQSLGVRVCAPYTFEVGDALRHGENELEVLVYNTLAPYLDAISPTSFVFHGQKVSGLFGPVRLRW
ncbi:hypothetical protein [Paractinoplanes globisporus]|uniref:Alpha-L-rhamnosidase-like protein n=1 Tax=Paractinoplanes globisporus TaxID=113565 RepID=A0ABW6WGA5_9ACTN|nr:hypothetical protein [Actinoplanes globisporus]